MEHTHEYDCVVCGAHFDNEKDLQRHDQAQHEPKLAIDPRAPAEPMGNERPRRHDSDDDELRR
jgi:hypothetical protein